VQIALPGPAHRPRPDAGLNHARAAADLLALPVGRKIGQVVVVMP
jgi:hypothetical protein